LAYLARRIIIMIPTLLIISFISFFLIQLPPGDFVDAYIMALEQDNEDTSQELADTLRSRYGLDKSAIGAYLSWMKGVLVGDFGFSFSHNRPVRELIGERLLLTIVVTSTTMLFTWVVSFAIGVYTALRPHSVGDYIATFIGFIGLAVPNFMLALLLMFVGYKYLGLSVGGLFSNEFANAAWSWGKFVDMLKHIWVPVIVIGTAGTAGMIRIMRANLLDELHKPYVTTARSKGLPEWRVVLKYPVRLALNPFVSTIGWMVPRLVSGGAIVAVVLSLPTTGPLLLSALRNQDMYLAGSFLMFLASLTVVGTLISDILLALLDPRIRY
jgi:peptide/nickel transport system permease protein